LYSSQISTIVGPGTQLVKFIKLAVFVINLRKKV